MSTRVLITASDYSKRVLSAGGMNARDYLIERIEQSPSSSVELVDHADDAELILFAESHLTVPKGTPPVGVLAAQSPVARAHPHRCIVHDGSDHPIPVLPGLYPSMPSPWASRIGSLGAPYLVRLNPFIDQAPDASPSLLACFMGSCKCKPVRNRLLRASASLGWERIAVRDTGKQFVKSIREDDLALHNQLKQGFAAQMVNAQFAICPAGAGLSSYRVFEAMQCGRAPIIIADNWLPPEGPDWDRFSIRIPESRLADLPSILTEYEPRWYEMGKLAHSEWVSRYSPETIGPEIIRLAQLALSDKMSRARMRRAMSAIYRAGPAKSQTLRSLIRRRYSNE